MKSRTRRTLSLSHRILFIGIFFILSLLVSEILLRFQEPFLGLMKKHDVLPEALEAESLYVPHLLWDHTLAPNLHKKIFRSGAWHWYQTNSLGFRDAKEIEMPKPENVFRIFVLGDSFTEGSAPGATVSNWIEKVLKQQYPETKFEVINAGVSSESLIPYMVRLNRQIFALQPNLVVVNVDNTDVRDDLSLVPAVKLDSEGYPIEISKKISKYKELMSWLESPLSKTLQVGGRYSYLLRFVWNILFAMKHKASQFEWRIRQDDPAREKILQDYFWVEEKSLSPLAQILLEEWEIWPQRLIALCRKHHTPLILSSYPHPDQISGTGGRWMQKLVQEIAESEGVSYFDAYQALRVWPIEKIYLPEDIHYNDFGNQKWGEALGYFISQAISPIIGSSGK